MELLTDIKDALTRAFKLEESGYFFYTEAARRTTDEKGKQMFWYLAGEEKKHFERVRELWSENLGDAEKAPAFNPDASSLEHGVFGSDKTEDVDELDALNAGIDAEELSITLYRIFAKRQDFSKRAREAFDELVGEEQKHLAILSGEVEFVTQTGEYTDFKTVGA